MTNDLVKRLRAPHNWFSESDEGHRGPNNAPEEAADRIEELEAENARLRDALSEYVYETTHLSPTENDGSHWCKIPSECLRKARAALEEKKDD